MKRLAIRMLLCFSSLCLFSSFKTDGVPSESTSKYLAILSGQVDWNDYDIAVSFDEDDGDIVSASVRDLQTGHDYNVYDYEGQVTEVSGNYELSAKFYITESPGIIIVFNAVLTIY